ncbi:ABC transporter ATP-binding protein [Desmospora profundinema]|uniref:ABC-type lipoprotein export system ATPase subunit n=1 Tax=Desmospora profundinema TaxID=1571184 RepID=A0ABU1IQ31_9BACL|nr:ABC transporter ATP-binding protein [Desmospora profundinema]MDR6226902.1 ABC-type lipoprotein export system ATPase subunit [Desmospora profundinema]
MLEARLLTKIYGGEGGMPPQRAVNGFHLSIHPGEWVGVMGPSGSGKTSLLRMLGTLDLPTSGELWFRGRELTALSPEERAHFRRCHLGFIFQDFRLLEALTLRENTWLPLVLAGEDPSVMQERSDAMAAALGLENGWHRYPRHASGGEKQRAAAIRAMIHRPDLVLADEPTGNLDSKASRALLSAMDTLRQEYGSAILMVTHDPVAASRCERVLFIRDGTLMTEIRRGEDRQDFLRRILTVVSAMGGERLDLEGMGLS